MTPFVTIAGVAIHPCFVGVVNGRKVFDGKDWVLTTKKGCAVANFPSEAALDAWWVDAQRRWGRTTINPLIPVGSVPNSGNPPQPLNGAAIDPALSNVSQAWKYRKKHRWVVATEGGREFARFSSEAKADAWWREFQTARGRSSSPLTRGRPPKGQASEPEQKAVESAGRGLKPSEQERQTQGAAPTKYVTVADVAIDQNPLIGKGALPQRPASARAVVGPNKNTGLAIAGVFLDASLACLSEARKYSEGEEWVLATATGRVIARFQRESALDAWWAEFQTSRGRTPSRVQEEYPEAHPARKFVTIACVAIDHKFIKVTEAWKGPKGERWLLYTKDGEVIADFCSEGVLEDWWRAFQRSQGRHPKPLLRRLSKDARRGKIRNYDTVNQPWPDDKNMPIFDAD